MKNKLYLLVLLLILSLPCFSQGCSDAGFCSIDALKNEPVSRQLKHNIDIGINYGYGEQKTFTYNPYIQYGYTLSEKFFVQGKITATNATGFLGSSINLGDFYAVGTYHALKNNFSDLRVVGGIKIPLNTANANAPDGTPLPLDYQSSLGTYDLIAGINYIAQNHFEVNTGFQLPIIQNNHNKFLGDGYTDSRIKYFAPTNNFQRKPDVLLRLGYYINLPYSIALKPNLLAIYRLAYDSYQDKNGRRTPLIGTQGLTLNEGINLTKQFKNNNKLEIIAAMPLVSKRVDDGLIRELVLNIQYSIAF